MTTAGSRVHPSIPTHPRVIEQTADRKDSYIFSLLRAWKRLQVSYYGGKYSIERALALGTYSKTWSLARVVLMCIGTPVPMFVLVILQEIIPLQDPAKGWSVQYGFWLRAWILAFVVGQTITGQARFLVDGVVISEKQLAVLSAFAGALFTVTALIIAAYIVFPVPFFVLTLAPLFYLLLIISFRIVMGGQVLREMVTHSSQLIRYIIFVCAQVMVACVYPLYEALFRAVQGSRYQILVILLLPVIKMVVKNIFLRCAAHMEDMVPEAVIFTVDFFNSLYIATCMQSASSIDSILTISVTDLVQTCVMLYGLHRRTYLIRTKLYEITCGTSGRGNVLEMLCSLCGKPDTFTIQTHPDIRVRSCLPHLVSELDRNYLERLEKVINESHGTEKSSNKASGPIFTENLRSSNLQIPWSSCTRNRLVSIVPNPREVVQTGVNSQVEYAVVRETLQTLFTMECIVVASYLEAVVPLFYCMYIAVMVHLSSAKYHTEMVGITRDNVTSTIRPVLLFGLLQLVSFALLAVVIKRNCGMKALYQLAFVLDTQMSLIQGKLMLWMVITFCFRVVHFGMDFTFQFSWVDRQATVQSIHEGR